MNKVLVLVNEYLLIVIDRFLSDYDDYSKKNMLIDLDFLHNYLLMDDIELNEEVEYSHHFLHNVFLDEWIYYEDDQQNDLNSLSVFVEEYVLLLMV
jgi:hypothetical protein